MKSDEKISVVTLIEALVRSRKLVAIIIGAGIALSFTLALTLPQRFTATATILPSGKGNLFGKLGSLIGLQNSSLTDEIPQNSSLLFPTVLSSRYVRMQLLRSTFEYAGKKTTLSEILGKRDIDDALTALDALVGIGMDKKTGIIRIRVTTNDPDLSAAVANRLIDLLRDFNVQKKRKKAWYNYEFLSNKLSEASKELFAAESTLTAFEKRHRDYTESTDPSVVMEHEKLTRELELKENLFIDLTKEKELADIELKRQTPIVRVLDYASPPRIKSFPPRKLIVMAGGSLSLISAVIVSLLRMISLSALITRFI
ncbi:MAG: hypothetical protein B6D63_06080 [Candidatus Latescibacteria bacterium 4484_7]|nr:MAG: hypothetical protein B6D63_06080 [Candidatus Latescibacteria bacterium 4484_7]